ncbi:MAG TPA: polysaccharide biosynthesis/export family protein [Terracidiphilus sp.]|nr:polysaccharide biosynthesis/export family protein [Terracidiphilus sp.]
MRNTAIALIALFAAVGAGAQHELAMPSTVGGATTLTDTPTLPVGRIGDNDLIGVSVYDAPELTRPVRVTAEGDIRLPLVKQPIHVAGLYPDGVEEAIRAALINDQVLVDPIVTVSIMEYDSRPITVVGAVKSPVTFQAMGSVTLLDAISRAQGLADDAGSEILISSNAPSSDGNGGNLVQRVPVQSLFDSTDPASNIALHGGEVIRVPEAGRVYVVGDVNKPGYYFITEESQSSVMKALAFSAGLGDHAGHVAFIYRKEQGAAGRNEIPVPLKKIMDRKSPDVALDADDILYIPGAKGRGVSAKVLQIMIEAAPALGVSLLTLYH